MHPEFDVVRIALRASEKRKEALLRFVVFPGCVAFSTLVAI